MDQPSFREQGAPRSHLCAQLSLTSVKQRVLRGLTLSVILGALLILAGCGANWNRVGPWMVDQALQEVGNATYLSEQSAMHARRGNAVARAMQVASRGVERFDTFGLRAELLALRHFQNAKDPSAVERILLVLDGAELTDPQAESVVRALWFVGRFDEAQALIDVALQRGGKGAALWHRLHVEGLMANPWWFDDQVHTAVPGEDLDELARLGGGSTVTLKFRMNDSTIGAFKPNQTRRQSNYRAELAAFRLCGLLDCTFSVPRNREVRIRHADFLELYGLRSIEGARGYGANFVDLIWYEEDGERYVHGTLKEWVPGFTGYRIERSDVWSPLVSRWMNLERLQEMELSRALAPLRMNDGNYRAVINRAEDTDAFGFARQVSELHVFDYLLNNWDRYSTAFPGANCQWNHGRFVSIDNGAGLQPGSNDSATWGRQLPVERFSERGIEALHHMDIKLARALLFPQSEHHDEDEARRYKQFLVRRLRLLARVGRMAKARGRADVLAF